MDKPQAYKARLFDFADLIEDAIVTIKAQAFSDDAARNLQSIARIIMEIYSRDETIKGIMHKMISALTGEIDSNKTNLLSALNKQFRDHIRKLPPLRT
ncbi:hypothetical protein HY500_03210 [Candidatus Woesearchaeota archaeon]|nr:hypothetical protein [Candidatus Woesearchaeota archaeon]